jgi:hypothetical protein
MATLATLGWDYPPLLACILHHRPAQALRRMRRRTWGQVTGPAKYAQDVPPLHHSHDIFCDGSDCVDFDQALTYSCWIVEGEAYQVSLDKPATECPSEAVAQCLPPSVDEVGGSMEFSAASTLVWEHMAAARQGFQQDQEKHHDSSLAARGAIEEPQHCLPVACASLPNFV